MARVLFFLIAAAFFLAAFRPWQYTRLYSFKELKYFPEMPSDSSNPVTLEGVALGRYLFYDTILSLNKTLSCASCHQQENAFSDALVRFSKGSNGLVQSRNTPALFNLAWHPSFFWDGRASSIENLVFHPVREPNEMNLQWSVATRRIASSSFYRDQFKVVFGAQPVDSNLIAKAIGQFLRTLISAGSQYDRVLEGKAFFTADEFDGFVLVNDQTRGDCLHCHTTDGDRLGTTFAFSNNGLDSIINPEEYPDKGRGMVSGNKMDNGKFKTPSLRNIALTAPYMHDGRFNSLEEVLDFYSEGVNQSINIDSKMEYAHQKGVRLSKDEKRKIIAFLHTLTDSTFITNPEFSNPFRVIKKQSSGGIDH